jgi:hypothetical protein
MKSVSISDYSKHRFYTLLTENQWLRFRYEHGEDCSKIKMALAWYIKVYETN